VDRNLAVAVASCGSVDISGVFERHVSPTVRGLTVEVTLTTILDLRVGGNQAAVGLSTKDLFSPVGEYARCQRIGQAAHQLGLHGIIAPAATGLGETLAVLELHLPPEEQPILLAEEEWVHLPEDPRRLRIVE
jgi:hypothetical protein